MGECYHSEARFSDPVFLELNAEQVRTMWRMLLSDGKDLRIDHMILEEDSEGGVARWNAYYTFTRTGRKVHNVVLSRFRFRDGMIIAQRDSFDLWRWSRQALGPVGWLLGWSPKVHNRIRSMAAAALHKASPGP